MPDNVSLIFLPLYAPELNPVERVWLYLRERFLSLRLFPDLGAIIDGCCQALEPPHRRTRPHRLAHKLPLPAVSQDFMSRVLENIF
ncbi:transposase [Muricoccus pecuniae]|uniref:Tc1-like transposase DDE domain-containing protein n=1 Tax=Muricoccus pecuniae TaxID=693023 RepID=A0A840YHQ4_9PROT|nr:transposase [Roseomonas pecuniae]MBB5695941.1 hypothetical protein [Roseomonas pecuniae]